MGFIIGTLSGVGGRGIGDYIALNRPDYCPYYRY